MTDTSGWVLLLSFAILFTFFLVFAAFWIGWRFSQGAEGLSPYTGLPLRHSREIPYSSAEKVWLFMDSFQQYDNRPFKIWRSAFCRDTGRIFPDTVTWLDTIRINWTFLQKRYPGHYVSWGSLNKEQQEAIREAHETLEGFQTEFSSPKPSPRAIELDYAYAKPGPLYVDINTKVLLGWKIVPETNLEVLIVQKPKQTMHY